MYETKESAACGSVAPSCGTSQLEVQELKGDKRIKITFSYEWKIEHKHLHSCCIILIQ